MKLVTLFVPEKKAAGAKFREFYSNFGPEFKIGKGLEMLLEASSCSSITNANTNVAFTWQYNT